MNYNKEKILKRLNRKPTFFNQTISILEAYITKSILVSKVDRLGQPLIEEYVELYFTNKKRCGVDTYLSMRERHPFWLITFEDQVSVEKILANKHMISKQELMVERLINFEILAEGIKILEISALEHGETTTVAQTNSSHNENSLDKTLEMEMSQVSISDAVDKGESKEENKISTVTRPTIFLNLENEPNIKIFYLFDEDYFKQFTDELFDKEAAVMKINSDQPSIRIECSSFNPEDIHGFEKMKNSWITDVTEYIRGFLDQFDVKLIQMENIDDILKRLKYDQMRVQCVKVVNGVELCGFKNLVHTLSADIYAEFARLQSNQNEIIEDKRTGFKLYQLRVLFVNRFIKQMRDKHENMMVKIDARNNLVYLKGTREQVKDANENLDMIIKNIKTINMPADDLLIKLIENKEMDIVTWLKDKDILCTLEPDSKQNIIIVHSTDRDQLERCKQAFFNEMITNEVDASLLSEAGDEQEIIDFVESFEKEQGVVVSFSNSAIRICGFSEKVNEVYTKCIEKM